MTKDWRLSSEPRPEKLAYAFGQIRQKRDQIVEPSASRVSEISERVGQHAGFELVGPDEGQQRGFRHLDGLGALIGIISKSGEIRQHRQNQRPSASEPRSPDHHFDGLRVDGCLGRVCFGEIVWELRPDAAEKDKVVVCIQDDGGNAEECRFLDDAAQEYSLARAAAAKNGDMPRQKIRGDRQRLPQSAGFEAAPDRDDTLYRYAIHSGHRRLWYGRLLLFRPPHGLHCCRHRFGHLGQSLSSGGQITPLALCHALFARRVKVRFAAKAGRLEQREAAEGPPRSQPCGKPLMLFFAQGPQSDQRT